MTVGSIIGSRIIVECVVRRIGSRITSGSIDSRIFSKIIVGSVGSKIGAKLYTNFDLRWGTFRRRST